MAKLQQERDDAETELRDEKVKVRHLEQDIAEQRRKNSELEHRLTVTANVTKIQPALKFVPAEIDFDITDFYEELKDEPKTSQNFITRNFSEEQDFYRGVYHYSGKTFLMVDLQTVKLCETEDEITIYGPFVYSQACESKKEEWLLHGRRERVSLFGESKNDMKLEKIEVTEMRDCDGEDKQIAMLRENVKHLKMIEQMRIFTDDIVKHLIELMLKPTGKRIKFIESTPEATPDLKLLGVFISEFNRRMETRKQIAE